MNTTTATIRQWVVFALVALLLLVLARGADTTAPARTIPTTTAGYGCSLYVSVPSPCDPDSAN